MSTPSASTCAANAASQSASTAPAVVCSSVKACALVPSGGHAVALLGLEVRGAGETRDVGGARRGDGGLLVGAPRTHLDQRACRRRR